MCAGVQNGVLFSWSLLCRLHYGPIYLRIIGVGAHHLHTEVMRQKAMYRLKRGWWGRSIEHWGKGIWKEGGELGAGVEMASHSLSFVYMLEPH